MRLRKRREAPGMREELGILVLGWGVPSPWDLGPSDPVHFSPSEQVVALSKPNFRTYSLQIHCNRPGPKTVTLHVQYMSACVCECIYIYIKEFAKNSYWTQMSLLSSSSSNCHFIIIPVLLTEVIINSLKSFSPFGLDNYIIGRSHILFLISNWGIKFLSYQFPFSTTHWVTSPHAFHQSFQSISLVSIF